MNTPDQGNGLTRLPRPNKRRPPSTLMSAAPNNLSSDHLVGAKDPQTDARDCATHANLAQLSLPEQPTSAAVCLLQLGLLCINSLYCSSPHWNGRARPPTSSFTLALQFAPLPQEQKFVIFASVLASSLNLSVRPL